MLLSRLYLKGPAAIQKIKLLSIYLPYFITRKVALIIVSADRANIGMYRNQLGCHQ